MRKKCIIQQKLGKSETGEGQTATQLSTKETQLDNTACDTAVFRIIKHADSEAPWTKGHNEFKRKTGLMCLQAFNFNVEFNDFEFNN